MGLGNRIIHAADGGLIAYYGLSTWWEHTFTQGERQVIRDTCDPSGDMSLTSGRIWESSGTAVQMLNGLTSHFLSESGYPVAIRLLEKAFDICGDGAIIDQHYTCERLIQLLTAPGVEPNHGHEVAAAACQCQIDLAPQLAAELFREGAVRLPKHLGYETLVELRDTAEQYEDAIRLCRQARHDGWSGDWDRTLKRVTRKLARRQSPPDDLHTDDPDVTRERLGYLLRVEAERFAPQQAPRPEEPEELEDDSFVDNSNFFASLAPSFMQSFAQSDLEPNVADMRAIEEERERMHGQLERDLEAVRAERDALLSERAALIDQLETAHRRADAGTQEVFLERAAREVARRDLDAATSRIAELESSVHALKAQSERVANDCESLLLERQEWEEDRRQLEARLSDMRETSSERAVALERANAEIERLEIELAEAETQRATDRAAADAVSLELETLRSDYARAIEERDANAAAQTALETELKTAREALEEERTAARHAKAELADREEAFRVTLEEKVAVQSEKARLATHLAELEYQAEERKNEIEQLHAELDDFHADAAQRMAAMSVMKAELDDMRRVLREREKLAEEVSRLGVEREAAIQSLEDELETMRNKYKSSARRQEDLEAQLDDSDAKLVALHDELDAALTRAHETEREIMRVQDEAAAELKRLQVELDRAQSDFVQAAQQSAQHEEHAATLRADLESTRATQNDLIAEMETLRKAQSAVPALPAPVNAPTNAVISAPIGMPNTPHIEETPTTLDSLRLEVQALRKHVDDAVSARDRLFDEVRRVQATALQHAQTAVRTPPPSPLPQAGAPEPGSGVPSILNPEWEYDPYTRPAAKAPTHILYECPHCRRNLRIPRQFAGWFGQCKLCGNDITVPKP